MRLSGMVTRGRLAAVLIGWLATAGCATSAGSYAGTKIYLGGDERIVVRGAAGLRERQLNQYQCQGEMVLACSVYGSVAECRCSQPYGAWGGRSY
jgi:hypothetical protein